MTTYRFEIPGCPVPKERARVTRKGTFTPQRTREYENKVKLCAYSAGVKKLEGPVALSLWLYLPDKRRRDNENMQKSIQDALNGIAYEDDSQVKEWHGCIEVDAVRPRALVRIDSL